MAKNNEIKIEICQTKQLNLSARLNNIIESVSYSNIHVTIRVNKMKECSFLNTNTIIGHNNLYVVVIARCNMGNIFRVSHILQLISPLGECNNSKI